MATPAFDSAVTQAAFFACQSSSGRVIRVTMPGPSVEM
jgi:hypothetical protein